MLDAVLLMPNPDLGIGGIAIADPSSSFPAALAREFVRDLTLLAGEFLCEFQSFIFRKIRLAFSSSLLRPRRISDPARFLKELNHPDGRTISSSETSFRDIMRAILLGPLQKVPSGGMSTPFLHLLTIFAQDATRSFLFCLEPVGIVEVLPR